MRGNVKVYQKKIVEQRRKKTVFIAIITGASFLLVCGGMIWLSHLETFRINHIEVEGNERLAEAEIIALIEEKISGNYLGLFSRKNIFLYPEETITAALEVLPVVYKVTLNGKGFHTVKVTIEERKEVARFCEGELGEKLSCFSVDEEGFMFDAVQFVDSKGSLVYRDTTITEPLGAYVLPSQDFDTMQFFMRELSGLGLVPDEALFVQAGYMRVMLVHGGQLIINRADDLSEVLSNLSSLLSNKKNIPSLDYFVTHLDYMRLDSGNKIFYKLRE